MLRPPGLRVKNASLNSAPNWTSCLLSLALASLATACGAKGEGEAASPSVEGTWVSCAARFSPECRQGRDVDLDLRADGTCEIYDLDPSSALGPRLAVGEWSVSKLGSPVRAFAGRSAFGVDLHLQRRNGVPLDERTTLWVRNDGTLVLPEGRLLTADGIAGTRLERGARTAPRSEVGPPPREVLLAHGREAYAGLSPDRLARALRLEPDAETRAEFARQCVEAFLRSAPELRPADASLRAWRDVVNGPPFPLSFNPFPFVVHLRALLAEAGRTEGGRSAVLPALEALIKSPIPKNVLEDTLIAVGEYVTGAPSGASALAPRLTSILRLGAISVDSRIALLKALVALRYRPAVIPALRIEAWYAEGTPVRAAASRAVESLGPPPSAAELKSLEGIEVGVHARHYATGFEENPNSDVGVVQRIDDDATLGAQVGLRLDEGRVLGDGLQVYPGWLLHVIREEDWTPKRGARPRVGTFSYGSVEGVAVRVDWTERPNYPFAVKLDSGRWYLLDPRASVGIVDAAIGRRVHLSFLAPPDAPATAAIPVNGAGRLGR